MRTSTTSGTIVLPFRIEVRMLSSTVLALACVAYVAFAYLRARAE